MDESAAITGGLPQPGQVVDIGPQISIYPDRAQDYAVAVVTHLTVSTHAFADCLVTGLTEEYVNCVKSRLQEITQSLDPGNNYYRYVYVNSSGGVTIDYSQALSDAIYLSVTCATS